MHLKMSSRKCHFVSASMCLNVLPMKTIDHPHCTLSVSWPVIILWRKASWDQQHMMTSSNGNNFRITGHLCGNSPVPGEFLHKGQWRGALMFSLICTRISGWVTNGEAGDLRRYRDHYDVIVMGSDFVCMESSRISISGPPQYKDVVLPV